jgi:flagellar biosynthesis/type III secretory pathway chaperone
LSALSELPSLESETPDPTPDADAPEAPAPEGSAEAEDQADSEPPPDSTDPEEDEAARRDWPGKAKRRVSQLTKQKKDLQTQLDEANRLLAERETELASAKTAEPAPPPPAEPEPAPAEPAATAQPVVGGMVTAEEMRLSEEISTLNRALKKIRENPNGLDVNGQSLSAEDLLELHDEYISSLSAAKGELRKHRSDMAAYGQRLNAAAAQAHPWLKNKADPRTVILEKIVRNYPGAQAFPGFRKVLADAIAYEAIQEQARKGAAPAARSTAPPPRQPARPAAAPVETAAARPNMANKYQRWEKSGSEADLKELLPDLVEARAG